MTKFIYALSLLYGPMLMGCGGDKMGDGENREFTAESPEERLKEEYDPSSGLQGTITTTQHSSFMGEDCTGICERDFYIMGRFYALDSILEIIKIINDQEAENEIGIYFANISGAYSLIWNKRRMILVSPDFFFDQRQKCNGYASMVAVIAHEYYHLVGGHPLNHTETSMDKKKEREKKCDEYAGKICKKLSLNQDTIINALLPEFFDATTYPSPEERKTAIIKGYNP